MSRSVKIALVVGVVGALVGLSFLLPVRAYIGQFSETARDLGIWGIGLFVLTYIAFTVTLIPASLLTLLAGFLWGVWGGVLIVWPAATAGAFIAYAIARRLGRKKLGRWLSESPRLDAYDRAIARRGYLVGVLLRLSPAVPFGLLNYGLGITRMTPRQYFVSTTFGMVPGMFLYVYLGSIASSFAELGNSGSSSQKVLLAVGLIATIAVVIIIKRIADTQLEEVEET